MGSGAQQLFFGIDFGTTNSAVAMLQPGRDVQLARFFFRKEEIPSCRSVLYFEQSKTASGLRRVHGYSGPEAIERYLDAEEKGRLVQSLKSHLSSRSLTGTEIFGRRHRLEELVMRIVSDLRKRAEEQFGRPVRRVTVGRPVRFVGAESEEEDDFAVSRLRDAFMAAGFEDVEFELEPIAAALAYEATLDRDELILIGDFGGGTSDFSLLRVGPEARGRGRTANDLLGNAGVGLAGDAFDAKIVRHLVAPALGAGSQMRSLNKLLTVPGWVYSKLERWHYLSFLKARDTMEMLRGVQGHALEPLKIKALMHLIKEDLGFRLHRAVQAAKCNLSHQPAVIFKFEDGAVEIETPLERSVFESWIEEELERIETCVDSLLARSGAHREDVDAVFLTGGSSFVPAVRRIFETRFGAEKIRAGNEFTSVAHGLALTTSKPRSRSKPPVRGAALS